MSASILTTVKKTLGIDESDESFDPEIVVFINSVFSTLYQLGVGPTVGFSIEDESATWDDFLVAGPMTNQIKTYMYLKVRLIFDPPATSFAIDAIKSQTEELEERIHVQRELVSYVPPVTTVTSDDEELVIGGGTP